MIILKKIYKKDVYMGMVVVNEDDLTPEFIAMIKEDTEDKMGWRKYHGVLDRKARKKWRA